MKRRIISVLLAVLLMLPVFGMSALAAGSYQADWTYWYQGQSSFTLMKTSGSIMIAQAKLLAESEIINPLTFNPDDYLAWCRSSGCVAPNGIIEKNGNGSSMIAYASNKGTSVKLAATVDLTVLTPQEKVSVLKGLIAAGYYIILGDDILHQAYVTRKLSLTSGDIMVSESSMGQTTGLVFKYTGSVNEDSGEQDYPYAYIYSTDKKISLPVTLFTSMAATGVGESSVVLNAKCVFAGDTPSSIGYYIGDSRFNMRKGDTVIFPSGKDADDPISVSYSVKGLTPGTVYYYRLFAVSEGVEYSSEVMQFKTAGEAPEGSGGISSAFSSMFNNLINTIRSFFARIFSFLPFL